MLTLFLMLSYVICRYFQVGSCCGFNGGLPTDENGKVHSLRWKGTHLEPLTSRLVRIELNLI